MAISIDTQIPTPDGWTRLGDLQPGDFVFSATGKPQRVIRCGEVVTGQRCYRVHFRHEAPTIVATPEHEWDLVRRSRSRVRDVVTTMDLAGPTLASGRAKYGIRVARPLTCSDADLPIPPWTLGYWLARGVATFARVYVRRSDVQHVLHRMAADGIGGAVREFCPNGPSVEIAIGKRPTNVCHWGHARPNRGPCKECQRLLYFGLPRPPKQECLHVRLRDAGLLGDRHIPPLYLRASFAQRLELFRGLMDARASITGHKLRLATGARDYESKTVFGAAVELARTLGYRVNTGRVTHPNTPPAWQLTIVDYLDSEHLPVTLPRHIDKMLQAARGHRKTLCHYVGAVEAVESVPVRDVVLDTWAGTYLASEAMIAVRAASA